MLMPVSREVFLERSNKVGKGECIARRFRTRDGSLLDWG
jgi:hypothetical protein